MSRGFKVAMVVLLILLVIALVWLPFSPGFWVDWNMATANAHIPKVRQVLEGDARFDQLTVGADPEMEGSLCIAGVLPPGTTEELKELVGSTNPPRPILWQVTEFPFQGERNLPGKRRPALGQD